MTMLRQKHTFGILLYLASFVVSSQQLFVDIKNPKDILTQGITDVVGGINNATNKVNDALHDVSPNVLGPIADALDPDWLTGINYTRWVMDLDDALKDGNAEQWAKIFSKMFDVPRVIEEYKTSATTKASCLACKFVVNLIRHMAKSGKSDQEIVKMGGKLCALLQIQPARVCDGVMELIGIDVIQVIKESDMTPAQICSFHLNEVCLNGYDKRHDWTLTIPPSRKPSLHPTTPPLEGSPKLKVLQISDTHYDPYYQPGSNAECGEPLCCRVTSGDVKTTTAAAGKWGDYRKCDTPRHLFENALKHIADTHKDVDLIYWTGDLPPHDIWNQTREENLKNLRESAELMATYFKGIPIYPSVGNHESCPVDSYAPPSAPPRKNMSWLYDELEREWSRWLPSETSATIRKGAYYSTLVKPGFRVISVNGNYCSKNNFWLLKNSTDPADQLAWLIQQLEAAEANNEKVHIIGHIPPGKSDCIKAWSRTYYDIISRYEATIMAQFYGHTHYDEFEVFYDSKEFKRPVNVGYISPSITPWEDVNPAYRIYYIDGDHSKTSRSIVDHETWKMNLDEANLNDNPVWYKAYSAKSAYNMTSLLPHEWDNLINRMNEDKNLLDLYHRNMYRNSPVRPKCNGACQRDLLCSARSGRSHDKQNLCRTL